MPKKWNENSFTVELNYFARKQTCHCWGLISYDYVGVEQAKHEKDLLREHHYRLFKCFESTPRTTDAELCVILSKRRMTYPKILAQKSIFYPP